MKHVTARGLQTTLFVVFALAFVAGCAPVELPEADWQDAVLAENVWPPPPDKPRIGLLRIVSGEDDLQKETRSGRFLKWLVGDKEVQQPLVSPYGITADGRGRVWVADPGSSLVHVYDLADRSVEAISQAGQMALITPVGIAYDATRQRLYLSDSGLRKVFIFSGSGKYLGEIAGVRFERPAGLAVDRTGNLYVVDVLAGRVEKFDPGGRHLGSVGSAAAADGLFRHPSNVAVDAAGRLFIVDSLRFRVEIQSPDGQLLGLIGQVGDASGRFARPRGISVDSDGHVYVADAAFDNVQIFDLAGRLLLYFGKPGNQPGEFCLPAGIFIDHSDRLYVTEACNHRFQVFQYLR